MALPWATTPDPTGMTNQQIASNFKFKIRSLSGEVISENGIPLDFGLNLEPGGIAEAGGAPFVLKVPVAANMASVEFSGNGVTTAVYSPNKKLIRDAIEGLPDRGFSGNPSQQRAALLNRVSLYDAAISSQDQLEARRILIDELRPLVQTSVLDNYPILAMNEVTKGHVLSAIDSAISRLGSATVSISGRVLTPSGAALRNATVILTGAGGTRRTATTSSFGVYSFDNVIPGPNYILSVASKRYRFTPKTLTISTNLSNVDFVGLE